MKNGAFELLKRLAVDVFVGTLIVMVVAAPAVLVKYFAKWYGQQDYADPILVNGFYFLSYLVFAIDFVVAVAILSKLAWDLIKELWR